ncbi:MAG: HNH endonuclease signature motif containing protein [Caldilineaceae bacterium]|nr:HNH endonuclease signature motif containing protein [Caldilineaceae bacterium]
MNRACPDRSCSGVVRDGSCSHCGESRRNRLPDNRLPAHKRGYDKRWQRIRNAVLANEPLCRHGAEHGRLTAAVPVDHIVPLPLGTHSIDNLQPLCAGCHAVKTAAERSAAA